MHDSEGRLLHEWLRHSARRFPDAHAVVDEDRTTSFAELLAKAESLAITLKELGARQGDRVALVLHKTTDAIISIFGTLVIGAVYVPLSPAWPKERIEATLEDCAPVVVISTAEGEPQIAIRRTGISIRWSEAFKPGRGSLPEEGIQPEAPALILFTSGSTGKPKGVVLSHYAVSSFVQWAAREFQIGPEDRIAVPSPLGFDLSTLDIFTMALSGGTCVLVPGNVVWMPRFLLEFIRSARITCWYSVPSILAGMLEEEAAMDCLSPTLRLVLFAGEAFAGQKVARLQAAVPGAVCANLYGPTETNVVTWYRVPDGFDSFAAPPIGKACPYAEVMLDPSGELLAAGESTMLEYWNRPEETERAFLVKDGCRYYRTGDHVSQNEDGQYVFLGRLDRQVKRRGFRIELGEIESVLVRHEAVLDVAAVACEGRNAETLISVFVSVRADHQLDPIRVKAHCAAGLPSYMLPDRIVFIGAIPKCTRGKIDYVSLTRTAEALANGD